MNDFVEIETPPISYVVPERFRHPVSVQRAEDFLIAEHIVNHGRPPAKLDNSHGYFNGANAVSYFAKMGLFIVPNNEYSNDIIDSQLKFSERWWRRESWNHSDMYKLVWPIDPNLERKNDNELEVQWINNSVEMFMILMDDWKYQKRGMKILNFDKTKIIEVPNFERGLPFQDILCYFQFEKRYLFSWKAMKMDIEQINASFYGTVAFPFQKCKLDNYDCDGWRCLFMDTYES